ncbi:hypothetical protein [Pseudomonas putida]|uniref:hypothetical protein n=1 Tax=Pseudomonas putida TaxID=303 RepID=UPI0027606FE3|nr:hypothetical protein [Pseudomonas putida]MDP9524065.1 hypothetical protein [Pseudomonas putida]
MRIPYIDQEIVRRQVCTASDLLDAYKKDLDKEEAELERSERELAGLSAFIDYANRSEERLKVLRETTAGENYGLNELALVDADALAQYSRFSGVVQSHIGSCRQRADEIKKAIKILEKDIEALNLMSATRFRNAVSYFTLRMPGWDFLRIANKTPIGNLNIVSLSRVL